MYHELLIALSGIPGSIFKIDEEGKIEVNLFNNTFCFNSVKHILF